MELPELIYRLVHDESLQNLMKVDVEKAVASVGADLSREELEALAAVPWSALLSPMPLTTSRTQQAPDGWWISQLSHCPTPPSLSTTV